MDDLISRQAAIDAMLCDKVEITNVIRALGNERDFEVLNCTCDRHAEIIKALPTVQPNQNAEVSKMEIVHCKDCKHWNLQVGNVKGDGLGSCDFHNVNLVTGEGFCYWADKRGDSE